MKKRVNWGQISTFYIFTGHHLAKTWRNGDGEIRCAEAK